MKDTKGFFLGITASIFYTIGTLLMLFENTRISGAILLVIGFLTSMSSLSKKTKRYCFEDNFLFISSFLSLIIIAYSFQVSFSKNIIIISTAFYALNFLIQVNNIRKQNTKNKTKKVKKKQLKDAIKELKKEIKPKQIYYYAESGKSFHLAGCIGISRTKKENIKQSTNRHDLIAKGYKTCKICNS